MPFVLVTPPAAEPLSLAEAKDHLRVDANDAATNAKITGNIAAARQHVEKVTGRALVTQAWELVEDEFPSADELRLAKGELQSVTSVKYFDADGVEQTLAAEKYQVDTVRRPGHRGGRVVLASGASWPATQAGRINAVRVRFVAGYGAAAAVPEPIKQAMYLLIGHFFEHRESEVIGTISSPLQLAVDALLVNYCLR